MRFAFSSLVALVSVALVVAQTPTQHPQLNPDPSVVRPIGDKKPAPAQPQTNAKRFAAGLPPLSPRAHRRRDRNGGDPHGGRPGGGRPGGGRDDDDDDRGKGKGHKGGYGYYPPVPSPCPPINAKCNILVKNAADGSVFGFISPTWNIFGEYGIVQPGQAGSLEVSFTYQKDKPATHLDFLATNGPGAAYPLVGATVGFVSPSNDLVAGGYNYAYITGTTQIPAGPPVGADNNSFGGTTGIPKAAESAIWNYDPKTQAITPQWINTDGSPAPTNLVYANDFNQAFILTGDVPVFQGTFGVPYPPITFTCVPPA